MKNPFAKDDLEAQNKSQQPDTGILRKAHCAASDAEQMAAEITRGA